MSDPTTDARALRIELSWNEYPRDDHVDRDIQSKLTDAKLAAVARGDEASANQVWRIETMLQVYRGYVAAFDMLQAKQYYQAWCQLETVELDLHFARPHMSEFDWEQCGFQFIETHVVRWQGLFPYRLFFSPEIIEQEISCSICGRAVRPRSPCGHRSGGLYNGELCLRNVTKATPIGVSIVRKPMQKYSVIFPADRDSNAQIDTYDYSLVDYPCARLRDPFARWDYEVTKRRHPHEHFKSFAPDESCPCGSDSLYGDCCLKEQGVLRPHVVFSFEDPKIDSPLEFMAETPPLPDSD